MRGNPINIATGNKLEPEFDFATGGEWPLTLSRTYNWLWSAPGPGLFGTKWMSSLDYRLGFQRDSCYPSPGVPECTDTGGALRVYAYRPDGRKLQFSRQPTGDFRETKGLGRILKQPDGSWVHYTEDNMIEHYSVGGFPLSIRNSAGVGWTFRYGGTNNTQPQEVSHTSGRSIALAWQGSELREVRDPAGQVYRFTYTSSFGMPLLKAATLPGNPATTVTYHYGGEPGEVGPTGSLKGKSYNGMRYSWFTYDNKGLATGTEHAGVDKYTFSYTKAADGTLTVLETNPLGKQASYLFKDGKTLSVNGYGSAHCAAASKATTYDANGHEDLVTDFAGNKTDFDYDVHGHLVQRTEAAGSQVQRKAAYIWDEANNRILSETLDGSHKIDYTYNGQGRIERLAVTDLASGQTRVTTYVYALHPNGILAAATVHRPFGGEETYAAAAPTRAQSRS